MGTPALTSPKKNSATWAGYLHQISNRLNVSLAPGSASTKNPGSRAACGRKGMIGTSASAGWRPLQNSANHDRPPAEQIGPEALHPRPSQADGKAHRDGQDQRAADEMQVPRWIEQRECHEPERVRCDREQEQKRDRRMLSEDDSRDEIADGDIGRQGNGPADREHRLVERVDDPDVDQRRDNRSADRRNHRQQRPPPRVEHPAGRCRFDHLFGHQREEEHHGDVVDGERRSRRRSGSSSRARC